MNRRGFLGALASFAAVAAIDPAELLWTPTKTIFIPPSTLPMGLSLAEENQFVTVGMITQDALRILRNNLQLASHMNRDYAAQFEPAKIGSPIHLRRPMRYELNVA